MRPPNRSRHLKRLIYLLAALAVSACVGPQGKTGSVALDSPPDGAIIYSSALTVAGTAQGINAGGLIVTVTDDAGVELTRMAITERDGPFFYELIHSYAGVPAAVVVTVISADAPADPPYVTRSITLASLEHRPEGAYVDILAPSVGDEVGGDVISVSGRASGLAERTFTVELIDSNGTAADVQTVTLPPSYVADDLPWSVELTPGAGTGSGVIRVVAPDGTQLAFVPVVLSAAAG